jgi:hypothetical protein
MSYRVLVPTAATPTIPEGAALLQIGAGRALAYRSQDSFGECCAQAVRRGHPVPIPEGCVIVGYFDEVEGEINLEPRNASVLERWLGHRVYRNHLLARDNRSERRGQARRMMMQGRTHEAFRLDRRGGF